MAEKNRCRLATGSLRRYFVAPDVGVTIPQLLFDGSHRLHRNGIAGGRARNFGLLPSQLVKLLSLSNVA